MQTMKNVYRSTKRAFACWCFSNYLTSCNSLVLQFRLGVIKKQGGGGVDSQAFFLILSKQLGLIWYCSQSWEQIFPHKKSIPRFFFFLHAFNSLAFSSSAATFCCSAPQSHHPLYDSEDGTADKSLHTSIETLSSVISVPETLCRSWPFPSLPWVMGSGLSSVVTCGVLQPSLSSPPPHTSLCLSLRPIKKQPQRWQGPCWCEWLDRPQPTPRPWVWVGGSSVSFDLCRLPVSNKSFSQQAAPLWPRQSRNPTLSAADIQAIFADQH